MKKTKKTPRNKVSGFAEETSGYHAGAPRAVSSRRTSHPKVSASEFAKNFGEYREHALRGPLAVTSHGRTVGYFVSPEQFEEYQRIRASSRRAIRVVDLPKETIDAIRRARVPKKYDYLNALLDED